MGRRFPAASAWRTRPTRRVPLQQRLLDTMVKQVNHNSEIIARMKRVIDLMAELMNVRAALQTAGPAWAEEACHATAALKDAVIALQRVSCQFP